MIKVNMSDGKTLSFDLRKKEELDSWKQMCSSPDFQKTIRGVGIVYNTQWYAIPVPKKFKQIHYDAEVVLNRKEKDPEKQLVGERLICQVDDVQLSLLVYYGNRPKMARLDAIKIGKQRFAGVARPIGGLNGR